VIAGARRPAVDARASVTRERRSENGPLPVGRFPGLDQYLTIYDAGFDAGWELDLFGRTRRAVEAADARLEAAGEQRRDVLVSVISEVARSYFELRGAQEELTAANQVVAAATRALDLVRHQYAVGDVPKVLVSRAEAELRLAETRVPGLKARRDAAAMSLGVLLGQGPEAELALAQAAGALPKLGPVPIGTPADLLRRRPDVRLAERRLAAATADVGVAKGNLFPKLVFAAGGGLQALAAGDLLDAASTTWSVAPILSWHLLDGGRLRGEVRAAESRVRQAAIAYRASVLGALGEAERSLAAYRGSLDTVRAHQAAVAATEESHRLVQVRYAAGEVALLDLLDADRRLADARIGLAAARTAAAVNLVALYKALGGGWQPMSAMIQKANSGQNG